MADIETFESADAGASETFPMEAGQIKKGGYICIKNRPCKVVSISTSKSCKYVVKYIHSIYTNGISQNISFLTQ